MSTAGPEIGLSVRDPPERSPPQAALIEAAVVSIACVLDPGLATASIGPPTRPLSEACRRICKELGIAFTGDHAGLETLDDIARTNRFLYRAVKLHNGWHRQDIGSFLGYRRDDAMPVAVIRDGRRYCIVDPVTQELKLVDDAWAKTLAPSAAVFYARLPDTQLTFGSFYRLTETSCRADLRVIVLSIFGLGVMELIAPAASRRVFGEIIPNGAGEEMWMIVGVLAAFTLGRCLYKTIAALASLRMSSTAEKIMQSALWDRLTRLPTAFFRRFTVGDLKQRSSSMQEMAHLLGRELVDGLTVLGMTLFGVVAVVIYGGIMGFMLAVSALAFHLIPVVIDVSTAHLRRRQLGDQAQLLAFLVQVVRMIGKLKLAAAEHRVFSIWAQRFANVLRSTRKIELRGAVSGIFLTELPIAFSFLSFVLFGLRTHATDTGRFVSISLALGLLVGAAGSLVARLPTFLNLVEIWKRLGPVIYEPLEVSLGATAPGKLEGRIEFNQVSFGYDRDAAPVLKDISFTVEPGQMLAIVGSSGAGKSSIARLLLGFEKPWSGSVLLDGQDIGGLDLIAMRQQLGVVLQQSGLINGSILENIAPTERISEDHAWAVLGVARLAEDVKAMPMGVHTHISDNGALLSGGQRQRLMLARAILRNPAILILDEATSAIDNRTQDELIENLEALNMTRVVIAHRLSTVRHADRILLMDQGRIAATSTFDELMQENELFARLARRQLG